MDFFDQILNPNHSHTYTYANPRAHNLPAAPEFDSQICNLIKKVQIWKPSSSAFKGQITIPSPSWDFKEGFQIKTIHPNAEKR